MASKREKAPAKRMRRVALVICEGETEAAYVNMLKKWYKSPIRIISHIEGNRITQALIDKREREQKISVSEKVDTFLMYDMDVPAVNVKLMSCKARLLLSNPCFEIWLLFHARNQMTALNSDMALKELRKCASAWSNYNKASFTDTQKAFLKEHLDEAIGRAKALKEFQNPSSGIYKLIEMLGDSLK